MIVVVGDDNKMLNVDSFRTKNVVTGDEAGDNLIPFNAKQGPSPQHMSQVQEMFYFNYFGLFSIVFLIASVKF